MNCIPLKRLCVHLSIYIYVHIYAYMEQLMAFCPALVKGSHFEQNALTFQLLTMQDTQRS